MKITWNSFSSLFRNQSGFDKMRDDGESKADYYGLKKETRLLLTTKPKEKRNYIIRKLNGGFKIMLQFLRLVLSPFVISLLVVGPCCLAFCLNFDIIIDPSYFVMLITPLVFQLGFSINSSYVRREQVLAEMANFQAHVMTLFYLHRDWQKDTSLGPEYALHTLHLMKSLVLMIADYLENKDQIVRQEQLMAIYELFSNLQKANELVRQSPLAGAPPLVSRLYHNHLMMVLSFEKLRIIREFKTPRTIRSFQKFCIFIMPIVGAPYFAGVCVKQWEQLCAPGKRHASNCYDYLILGGYHQTTIVSIIFGALQKVQDFLDDPFDDTMMNSDNVDLRRFKGWIENYIRKFEEDPRDMDPPDVDTILGQMKLPRSTSLRMFKSHTNVSLKNLTGQVSLDVTNPADAVTLETPPSLNVMTV